MLQRFAIVLSAAALVVTAGCSQSDSGITAAVKTKLATDDTVKAHEINVDTHDHVVTLNGRVDTAAAKERAVVIARDTKGVTTVIDDITIEPGAVATSGNLDQKADAAGRNIKDKSYEAAEATKDAAHSATVKTEEAARDAKLRTEHAAERTGEVLSDAAITSAVKTKFLAEPGVSGLKIDVDTNNGVVTLSGNVRSQAEAEKAVTIARNSAGVKRVVNKLRVG